MARDAFGQEVRFVVAEDGSTDDTVAVLRRAAESLPLLLITSPERKGYSRAVIDGLRATTSEVVGFIDSDGQCDPADLGSMLAAVDRCDAVVGYRSPRVDPWMRKVISGAFGSVYRAAFPTPLKDPSCPYFLIHRPLLERILAGNVGIFPQGFWWEFFARAQAHGARFAQVPVRHRARLSGRTQVYRPAKLPGIAMAHLKGISALKRELRGLRP